MVNSFENENARDAQQISRRIAREVSLRALYVMEMRNCSADEALKDSLVNSGENVPKYAKRLLDDVHKNKEQINDIIRAKVKKWEFHRIALLDRLVLRLALNELLFFPDIPPKVAINEAIEIAKKYSTDRSGQFVNGILDAIYIDLSSGKLNLESENNQDVSGG